ncbi:hypothetical protein [Actinoallomurus sp. NPDC052274]|uniref:hypothetical protein n=1 Tax=Actinoallomurus sp. NPDC052274 TaxID=3155420 RepID=UPI0034293E63
MARIATFVAMLGLWATVQDDTGDIGVVIDAVLQLVCDAVCKSRLLPLPPELPIAKLVSGLSDPRPAVFRSLSVDIHPELGTPGSQLQVIGITYGNLPPAGWRRDRLRHFARAATAFALGVEPIFKILGHGSWN